MSQQERPGAPTHFALLHGGGQGGWAWEPTIAALRAQAGPDAVRSLALDIPGCGQKRGRATDGVTPLDVAHELIGDLEQSDMRDVVLVGHSLAGNVLPLLAELRPDLFRRLVYLACSIPLPGQTVQQMMGTGMQGERDDEVGWPVAPGPEIQDKYPAMYCNDMDEHQARRFLAQLVGDEWPASYFTNTSFAFANIGAVPATYVVCLQDRSLPVGWQETFAHRFAAGRLVRLDAGHQAMITRPHALAEALLREARLEA
jgi:pimeloyl-ACP methyl ester carboxylesterase